MKKAYPNLREELYALNWIKILDNAIQGRPTSWGVMPVREYRNASDEVCFALIHALEEKGLIDTVLAGIGKTVKNYKPKQGKA